MPIACRFDRPQLHAPVLLKSTQEPHVHIHEDGSTHISHTYPEHSHTVEGSPHVHITHSHEHNNKHEHEEHKKVAAKFQAQAAPKSTLLPSEIVSEKVLYAAEQDLKDGANPPVNVTANARVNDVQAVGSTSVDTSVYPNENGEGKTHVPDVQNADVITMINNSKLDNAKRQQAPAVISEEKDEQSCVYVTYPALRWGSSSTVVR